MRRSPGGPLSAGWMALLALGIAGPAGASPVTAEFVSVAPCDSLPSQTLTHELGTGPAFPVDESIVLTSIVPFSGSVPCGPTVDLVNDHLITILNTSGRPWQDLFFVADPGIEIFNYDGVIFREGNPQAFKIDSVGVNFNLLSESIAADGIFEPGESWTFAVVGFGGNVAPGAGVPSFGSLGLDAAGTDSNASIVANPAPTPVPLVGMGLVGIALVGVGLVLLSRHS